MLQYLKTNWYLPSILVHVPVLCIFGLQVHKYIKLCQNVYLRTSPSTGTWTQPWQTHTHMHAHTQKKPLSCNQEKTCWSFKWYVVCTCVSPCMHAMCESVGVCDMMMWVCVYVYSASRMCNINFQCRVLYFSCLSWLIFSVRTSSFSTSEYQRLRTVNTRNGIQSSSQHLTYPLLKTSCYNSAKTRSAEWP